MHAELPFLFRSVWLVQLTTRESEQRINLLLLPLQMVWLLNCAPTLTSDGISREGCVSLANNVAVPVLQREVGNRLVVRQWTWFQNVVLGGFLTNCKYTCRSISVCCVCPWMRRGTHYFYLIICKKITNYFSLCMTSPNRTEMTLREWPWMHMCGMTLSMMTASKIGSWMYWWGMSRIV